MKKFQKISLLAFSTLLFLTACGSASSDAKKIDVTKTAKPTKQIESNNPAVDGSQAKKVAPEFVKGKHYVEIFPEMQTDASAGKVEVIEMMWLGCPHCYTLEPTMLKYKKNHPDYVEFKQVPSMLNPSWASDANTYYIAEILDPSGEKDLINLIFKSMHEQKRRLRSLGAVKGFFVKQGFTEDQVDKVLNSMEFKVKIGRAQEISAASQAQSVPTVIINGKYRTSPYMAGGEGKLMKIIDMLTNREKK